MSDPAINSVLNQIRSAALNIDEAKSAAVQTQGQGPVSFGDVLQRSVDEVNNIQQQAGALAKSFERGDDSVELSEVMIEMQKARLSFEALSQVRTKLVSAYQEIMNMQI